MSTTLAIWGVRWRFSDGRPRFEAVLALIWTLRAESQGRSKCRSRPDVAFNARQAGRRLAESATSAVPNTPDRFQTTCRTRPCRSPGSGMDSDACTALLPGRPAVAGAGRSSRRLRCEIYLPTGNHLSYRGITALSSCRARRARLCYSAGLSSVIPLSPMAQEGSNELRL